MPKNNAKKKSWMAYEKPHLHVKTPTDKKCCSNPFDNPFETIINILLCRL